MYNHKLYTDASEGDIMHRKISVLFTLTALLILSVSAYTAVSPVSVYAEDAVRPNGHTVCLDSGSQNIKTDTAASTENAQNLDIAASLRDILKSRGYRVTMTQAEEGTSPGNTESTAAAIDKDAEILIRIDTNKDASSQKPEISALCTAGTGSASGTGSLSNESFRLSYCILDACCAATGFNNLGVQEDDTLLAAGSGSLPFTILKMSFPPTESASDPVADVEFREAMAGGIADGIDFYFGIFAVNEDAGDTKPISSSSSPSSPGMKTDAKLQKLENQLKEQLPKGNGQWAVYVGDLTGGTSAVIDSRPMQAASLIKLFIMGAVYENYERITGVNGTGNVDSLLDSMITQSDNTAANTLVSYLGDGNSDAGMQAVTAYCAAHGYTDSSMGRLLLQSNEFGDNYTSVKDCGLFLTSIYNNCMGVSSDMPGAETMYNLLKRQTRTNKIPSRLPAGVHAANKTGELGDVENDAGIIYDTGKDNDLVVCFMSENVTSPGAAQSAIGELSLSVYNYFNG